MSSILINSQLRRSWKEATKLQTRAVREQHGQEARFAARPSISPPPTEEFGDALRALSPFLTRGLNSTTFGAIVAAAGAATGIAEEVVNAAMYVGGIRNTASGVSLSWSPGEYVGSALVLEESFPLNSFFPETATIDRPACLTAPNETFHNLVGLMSHPGRILYPQLITRDQMLALPEGERSQWIQMREQVRIQETGSGVLMHEVSCNMWYTGCWRQATEQEIDRLFDNVLVDGAWLKLSTISWRDFFSLSNVSSRSAEHAFVEMDNAIRRSGGPVPAAEPSAPAATNVASTPRTRRPSRFGSVLSPADINMPTPSSPPRSAYERIVREAQEQHNRSRSTLSATEAALLTPTPSTAMPTSQGVHGVTIGWNNVPYTSTSFPASNPAAQSEIQDEWHGQETESSTN